MVTSRFAKWNFIVLAVVLILLYFWLDPTGRAAGWQRFFGRMHPALVHLPIGFMILGFLLSILQRVGWLKDGDSAINIALLMGSWLGIKTIVAGSWLAQTGGYPADLLFLHKLLGFSTVLLCAGLVWVRTGVAFSMKGSAMATALWGLILAGLLAGGDLGGRLTHGTGYVAEYAPDFLKGLLGQPIALEARFDLLDPTSTTVYDGIVSPILTEKCSSCHGAERGKGRLRLHDRASIETHEGDEPLIVSGNPGESLLIQRIVLPEGHEDQMPPRFHAKPISYADVELLKWWVATGASFETTLAEADMPDQIQTILSAHGLGEIRRGVFALDLPEPDTMAISSWRANGIKVDVLAEEEELLSLTCTVVASCLRGEEASQLSKHITMLDLRNSDVLDADLSSLSLFPHLTRLNLSGTQITGSGLAVLKDLVYLEYLNLYGTATSDAALVHVAEAKTVTAVYLWQTAVTQEGVEQLRLALPDAHIDTGIGN